MTKLLAFPFVALFLAACAAETVPTEDPPATVNVPPAKPDPVAPKPDPVLEPTPPVMNARWQKFVDTRKDALVALAQPILACVAKTDTTNNPAFHGCIDWHSAVHGTWALLTLSRLTKDAKYEQATAPLLQPALLAQELDNLKTRGIGFEVPYGYAWFLLLAGERAKSGKTDLLPLAQHVSGLLDTWATGLTDTQLSATLLADDYQNISWAVLNLWQYAVSTGNTALADRMVALVRTRLMPRDADCPLTRDSSVQGFFPACLHRARALATMLPATESKAWASAFLPKTFQLTPVSNPVQAHEAGLNFSRSWSLYGLYKATGNEAYRDLYLDHMEPWLKRSDIWAGDYSNYSHWVAQFGVYALAQSFD